MNKNLEQNPSLQEKLKHLLEEIRIVLPGTQALLGFQFAAVFQNGFDKIPLLLRYLHLLSLGTVSLSTILLMTPVAYDRLVERNHNTEHFHELSSRLVVLALALLGIGLIGDLFVVTAQVTKSMIIAGSVAGVFFLLCGGLWFVYTSIKRKQQ